MLSNVFGFKNFDRWWFGALQSGSIETAIGDWTKGPIRVDPNELRESYSRWMRSRRYDGEELRDFEIGRRLRHLLPEAAVKQRRSESKMRRVYIMPELRNARKAFEHYIGSRLTWEDIRNQGGDEDDDL